MCFSFYVAGERASDLLYYMRSSMSQNDVHNVKAKRMFSITYLSCLNHFMNDLLNGFYFFFFCKKKTQNGRHLRESSQIGLKITSGDRLKGA